MDKGGFRGAHQGLSQSRLKGIAPNHAPTAHSTAGSIAPGSYAVGLNCWQTEKPTELRAGWEEGHQIPIYIFNDDLVGFVMRYHEGYSDNQKTTNKAAVRVVSVDTPLPEERSRVLERCV